MLIRHLKLIILTRLDAVVACVSSELHLEYLHTGTNVYRLDEREVDNYDENGGEIFENVT